MMRCPGVAIWYKALWLCSVDLFPQKSKEKKNDFAEPRNNKEPGKLQIKSENSTTFACGQPVTTSTSLTFSQQVVVALISI